MFWRNIVEGLWNFRLEKSLSVETWWNILVEHGDKRIFKIVQTVDIQLVKIQKEAKMLPDIYVKDLWCLICWHRRISCV